MFTTLSTGLALALFGASLLLNVLSSAVLAERLDQVGERFRFPPGLVGLMTALGADSPEIASAITALVGGQHDLGRGVIFGSNVFNVAFLLGFSALVAGRVAMGRANLLLNGGMALAVTLVVGAEAAGLLGPLGSGLVLAALLLPYVAVSSLRPSTLTRLPLPRAIAGWLAAALGSEERDEDAAEREGEADASTGRTMSAADGLSILPMLAVIVATSVVMVKVAVVLGGRWHVSEIVVGTFVVATLTGLPNLIAAVRLAAKGRGATLSSEAFNSNTLNLLVGIYGPSLIVAGSPTSHQGLLSIAWLVAITAAALVLGLVRRGFGRTAGGALVAVYAGFVLSVVL